MAAGVPADGDSGSRLGEHSRQMGGVLFRNHRISFAAVHVNADTGEVRECLGYEGDHRGEEEGGGEGLGAMEQDGGGDVCAVAKAHGDSVAFGELFLKVVGQFIGPFVEVGKVEHAFGKAAKPAVHPMLRLFSAKGEMTGVGAEGAA